MEAIKEKFKEFVHSEQSLFALDILVDEFDFTIPDYIESFYHELFTNPATSRKVKDGFIEINLEVPIDNGEFLFFGSFFEMSTSEDKRFEFSVNFKRKIKELSCYFNIFFFLFGNIKEGDEDFPHFKELKSKYKFGWFKLHYDDVLFFPLKDYKFSYKNMKVL
jgi:hypothetical protein